MLLLSIVENCLQELWIPEEVVAEGGLEVMAAEEPPVADSPMPGPIDFPKIGLAPTIGLAPMIDPAPKVGLVPKLDLNPIVD